MGRRALGYDYRAAAGTSVGRPGQCWCPLKGARQDLLQSLGLDRAQGRLLPLVPTLGQAPH